MKKCAAAFVAAFMCMSIVGCGLFSPPKPDSNSNKGKTSVTKSVETKIDNSKYKHIDNLRFSNNLKVNIYLDGTESMGGYVQNKSSVYASTLRDLKSVIDAKASGPVFQGIKFGDRDVAINYGSYEFLDKKFYTDKDTRLDVMIKNAGNPLDSDTYEENSLNIIVTDLFQTNSYFETMSEALKNKCFDKKLRRSFAIVGLKSQFTGTIFDIGTEQKKIDYTSIEGDETTYRPFYLMVIGKDTDVRLFIYEMQRKFAKAKVALFTNEQGYNSELELADALDPKDKRVEKFEPFKSLENKNKKLHFEIKNTDNGSAGRVNFVTKKLPVQIPIEYELVVDKLEKDVTEKGGLLDRILAWIKGVIGLGDKNKDTGTKYKIIKVPNKFLTCETKANINSNDINMELILKSQPKFLDDAAGAYRVTFSLVADRDHYLKAQNVFADWNFDEGNPPADKNEIGTKTQSIAKFTEQISDKQYNNDKPGFHNLEFYLDIK